MKLHSAVVVGRRRNNGDQWAYVMPAAAKKITSIIDAFIRDTRAKKAYGMA